MLRAVPSMSEMGMHSRLPSIWVAPPSALRYSEEFIVAQLEAELGFLQVHKLTESRLRRLILFRDFRDSFLLSLHRALPDF